ncbi:Fic family protein [Desulfosarcina sp. OttesenSCG-928-A07]|nr:Fic family protein [Desulfosarcina sp. OttesenSCG-928-G17]MDL2329300.1 Fic family protein [Desulfosarcina sp. OttesenSCG-928-A07]
MQKILGGEPNVDRHDFALSLGFSWDPAVISLPHEDKAGLALFIFKKNMAGIVWNALGVFENNPSTLPQTETILQGRAVGGISIDELSQVKRFGDGTRRLIASVKNGDFRLDIDFAKALHAIIGKEEALEWGVLRNRQIHIHGVSHIPPVASELPAISENGFSFLRKHINSPIERAIATFLFMSRTQFFCDCNKRTASLMMNGVLLSAGYYPITVLKETTEEFNEKLRAFYNSGDGTEMFGYFKAVCEKLYPVSIF